MALTAGASAYTITDTVSGFVLQMQLLGSGAVDIIVPAGGAAQGELGSNSGSPVTLEQPAVWRAKIAAAVANAEGREVATPPALGGPYPSGFSEDVLDEPDKAIGEAAVLKYLEPHDDAAATAVVEGRMHLLESGTRHCVIGLDFAEALDAGFVALGIV